MDAFLSDSGLLAMFVVLHGLQATRIIDPHGKNCKNKYF